MNEVSLYLTEVNPKLEASSKPKASLKPESSLELKASFILYDTKEASSQLDTDMELERENWALSLTLPSEYEIYENSDEILKDKHYTQNY